MKREQLLHQTREIFSDLGISNAYQEAQWLVEELFETTPSESLVTQWKNWVEQREQGTPLAYIFGHWDFYGRRFQVGRGVLIPRPETEEIVTVAQNILRAEAMKGGLVIDLGAGSGCIGLTLLDLFPHLCLVGVESSSEALSFATNNGRPWKERVCWVQKNVAHLTEEDIPPSWRAKPRFFIANPPYISKKDTQVQASVKRFEPSVALFCEDEGLAAITQWADKVAALSRSGESYVFEMGAGQAAAVVNRLNNRSDFTNIQVGQDLAGRDRWVQCQKI